MVNGPKQPMEKPAAANTLPQVHVLPDAHASAVRRRLGAWKGLLWCEWYAHSKLLLAFIVGWLLAVWCLPLFTNPGWILAYGALYALIAGPAFAGGDIIDGAEEFAFALPPTRSERYIARLVIAGGMLLIFTLLDFLTLGLDLSQAIVRLYLDTGLIRPVEILRPRLLYGLVFAFPFSVFGLAFSLAANARGRTLVFTSWCWAGLAGLVVLKLGMLYESWSWGAWVGAIACAGLVTLGAAALWIGYRFFCRKEIVHATRPFALPSYWWLWLCLILAGIGLALFLVDSLWHELVKITKP
jgi:hypothetical protein